MSKNPIRVLWVTFAAILGPFAAPPAGAQELLVGQVAALTTRLWASSIWGACT